MSYAEETESKYHPSPPADEAEAAGAEYGDEAHDMASASSHNLSLLATEPTIEAGTNITPTTLYLWLRRANRKFTSGLTVIKVLPSGKIARRQLFIGAKAEVGNKRE
eukprot:Protomagalhaensia_wolfi_Nauph_80__4566@NODE_46_length_4258_cov_300_005452_g37_i0_p6_GENE_NODE_46_length_4258_cov_300_005452_g37_i0NODE_46_length_4258_cov_300_005452_g37_i0_p6_ORF_typecomplete_len107_score23_78_NODE_46_length_4258_cov_300_005452_g37_i025572877